MATDGFSHFHGVVAFHPILPADDHLRGIDHAAADSLGIGLLPLCVLRVCKGIFPADVVPVIHMQGQGDHIRAFGQFGHEFIGGRAGRAALRGEKLDHDGLCLRIYGTAEADKKPESRADQMSHRHVLHPQIRILVLQTRVCACQSRFCEGKMNSRVLSFHGKMVTNSLKRGLDFWHTIAYKAFDSPVYATGHVHKPVP